MVTAQQTYREMMKKEIAPGLRALGFKGSGANYERPSPDHWVMIGFQKSPWSAATRILFTVNVLVARRDAWEERTELSYIPARPTANTFWGEWVWQHRLGELVPGGQEIWWEVEAGMVTEQLADAVLWAVKDYALPAIEAQTAT